MLRKILPTNLMADRFFTYNGNTMSIYFKKIHGVTFLFFQDVTNEGGSVSHDNTTDCSMDDMASSSSSTPSSPSPDRNKPRSVIEGGTEVGWTPLSSVILWRRMLGIMGNVNHIKDTEIHATVFKHLIELWRMLATVSSPILVVSLFF